MSITKRGGQNEERLYLEDLKFVSSNADTVQVEKTHIDLVDTEDLVVRHKARYYPVGLFLRPGMSLLDFPCGSGYAAAIFRSFNIHYEGRDNDPATIEYAERMYGDEKTAFKTADLCDPLLNEIKHDVIACIEGLEHIDWEDQLQIIHYFYVALKKNGILIVSSPEAKVNSGPNPNNGYHKYELTKTDFLNLLNFHFFFDKVELITHKTCFHTGEWGTTLYGICHKE